MNCHIQSLKTMLVLVALCLPVGLGVNMTYLLSFVVRKKKLCIDYAGMIVSYGFLLLLAALSGVGHPFAARLNLSVTGCVAGILGGVLCIFTEYFVGVFVTYILTRQWVCKVEVHEVYGNASRLDLWDILAVGVFVILEELIFRSAIVSVLTDFQLSVLWISVVATIVFAINHIHWGACLFVQKLCSGSIFILLYLTFDKNLLVPILAHLVQNFTLLWVGRRLSHE